MERVGQYLYNHDAVSDFTKKTGQVGLSSSGQDITLHGEKLSSNPNNPKYARSCRLWVNTFQGSIPCVLFDSGILAIFFGVWYTIGICLITFYRPTQQTPNRG